jgi:hypothetical protein
MYALPKVLAQDASSSLNDLISLVDAGKGEMSGQSRKKNGAELAFVTT